MCWKEWMNKIKVLHIIKTLGLGGAEVNLLNLVKAMDHQCFELHVAYASGGELEEKFHRVGVKLFKFSTQDNKIKSFASLGIIMRLANYLRKNHINIVHTHALSGQLWGAIGAKMAGCKIIEHVHDPRYESKEFLKSRGLPIDNQFDYVRCFAKLSDRVIVLTKANEDYLSKNKIVPPNRIKRLLNGIPLEDFKGLSRDQLMAKFHLKLNTKIVLSALRLSVEKNAAMIIKIADLVKKFDKNVYFIIAGDGPEQKMLQDLICAKGLEDQVKMVGYQPDIHELLSISDIFILPTLRELHSISMIEAMSMKVPVLVSQGAGCNDEFINHGEDGFVLDPFNPEEWADVIVRLLKDDALRLRVAQNALKKVRHECDIKIVAQKIEHLYEELMNA
jgi:glycosyltransferase involved in cell wall biosynthesis